MKLGWRERRKRDLYGRVFIQRPDGSDPGDAWPVGTVLTAYDHAGKRYSATITVGREQAAGTVGGSD